MPLAPSMEGASCALKTLEVVMNAMSGIGTVAAPTHPPSDFLGHENECRDVLRPWVKGLIDMAESAGWNRRTAASTLMFLAAQHVSAAMARND